MENEIAIIVYFISRPCGVGKSTIAKELSRNIKPSALIQGDEMSYMLMEGSELSLEKRFSLTWENILLLVRNFVRNALNVVVDWVIQHELDWLCKNLSDLNVEIKYVALRADEDILIDRLERRGDSHLVDRLLLENSPTNEKFIYDTTHKDPSDIDKNIIFSQQFRIPFS